MGEFLKNYEADGTLNDVFTELFISASSLGSALQARLVPRSLSCRIPNTCLEICPGGTLITDIDEGDPSEVVQHTYDISVFTDRGSLNLISINSQSHSMHPDITPILIPVSIGSYEKGAKSLRPDFYLGYQDPGGGVLEPTDRSALWLGISQKEGSHDSEECLEGSSEHYTDALISSIGKLELSRLEVITDSINLNIGRILLLAGGSD
jgi:hypothetical protein